MDFQDVSGSYVNRVFFYIEFIFCLVVGVGVQGVVFYIFICFWLYLFVRSFLG